MKLSMPLTLSGQQITRLTELPPAYNLQRSAQLLQQLMVLFPDNRKRKLTAVCSHQTRIGNLDAHLI